MEKNLKIILENCADLVLPTLQKEVSGDIYVKKIHELMESLEHMSEEEIKAFGFSKNVESSLLSDKSFLNSDFLKEADRVSLLSTLVTYAACQKEGFPEHSKVYMERVTELRHVIDAVYGESSRQFCGS
ncbi:MAG: hypothetical protein IJW67_05105 [Blautia sp.]|nr:hypothetical protein [Blautia sp.]